MVGLPGFEPESIEPKSTSLDQASREPQTTTIKNNNLTRTIKTYPNNNQKNTTNINSTFIFSTCVMLIFYMWVLTRNR